MSTAFPTIPPLPALPERLAEGGVRRMSVRATVEVEVFVAPFADWTEEDIALRIEHDLIDTIAYKAGYAADAERGDVVSAAPARGGLPESVVHVRDLEILADEPADVDEVVETAEAIASERP
ncbi:hypothetical protein ABRQ22_14820 [Cellulosimicrobium sp. ES-005]|uniref:Uncharacterized protein n=1 Tax=Cellulosimicrobium sp. ES-005 TaxID=3163031 RepID=A0AAU8FYG0_9MICO